MSDILIIDDERQMRRLLTRILTSAGHTVREAPNGRIGLELFLQARPQLVITDILMPEREGIETIRKIHADDPKVPILAISGGSMPMYLDIATKLGATAQLAKPFSANELLEVVLGLLERAAGKLNDGHHDL